MSSVPLFWCDRGATSVDTVMRCFTDPEKGCQRILLLKLVQLGMHAVSRYVKTNQVVLVSFRPNGMAYTKTVTGVRLEATFKDGASTLQELRTATPSYFRVTFIVPVFFTSYLDEDDTDVEEYSHIFRDCDLDAVPSD